MQDGTSKMSKSAESDASRINLLDPPDVLANKIKRAKTDGEEHLSQCGTAMAYKQLLLCGSVCRCSLLRIVYDCQPLFSTIFLPQQLL